MSGLLSMRRAAPPRHSLRPSEPRLQRLAAGRTGAFAKRAALVLFAAILLLSAVFLVLAVTSWASDPHTGATSSAGF